MNPKHSERNGARYWSLEICDVTHKTGSVQMKKRDKHAFRLSLCRANICKQMQIFKVKTKKRLGVAGCKVVWVLIRKGSQMRRNRTLSSLRGWDFISTTRANSEEKCKGSVTTLFLARFVCFQKRSNMKIIDRRRATGNGERENELPQGQSCKQKGWFDERRAVVTNQSNRRALHTTLWPISC